MGFACCFPTSFYFILYFHSYALFLCPSSYFLFLLFQYLFFFRVLRKGWWSSRSPVWPLFGGGKIEMKKEREWNGIVRDVRSRANMGEVKETIKVGEMEGCVIGHTVVRYREIWETWKVDRLTVWRKFSEEEITGCMRDVCGRSDWGNDEGGVMNVGVGKLWGWSMEVEVIHTLSEKARIPH